MEVYDELASCSSDEDDDYDDDEDYDGDEDYEPSAARDRGRGTKATLQKSGHDKENKNLEVVTPLVNLLKDGEDGKKVTVEQCKDYLRTHGLRLVGTKSVLIERIKEHLHREQKYDGFAQHSEATLTNSCGVPKSSTEFVHKDLIKSFANMELVHLNSVTIIELLTNEKKLTVDDCKAYLRKHGLRLSGTKQILIERIREHLQIQDDNGMTKYPEATFILDCQGDACVGDVVLFKQRVYEFFNVGGRCSAGPSVGVRTIAGRIIKESYGSAKQQHTFTVEVLWSTGDKALPPLHPLIIKGRNLYRVKTLRQAWADELARKKQLQEKHARGAVARVERRARIEGKKPNGNVREHEDKVCKIINNIGSHVGVDYRMERSNINYPIFHGGGTVEAVREKSANSLEKSNIHYPTFYCEKKVEPVREMSANILERKDGLSFRHAGKVDIVCSAASTFMHAGNVEPVSSVEVRYSSSLAGLIIGKQGANRKEIESISEAELCVEQDPANPILCIVKIRGNTQQKDVALKMVYQKVCCKFFAKYRECRNGEACKFSHSLLG